jgi:hypothetical protein
MERIAPPGWKWCGPRRDKTGMASELQFSDRVTPMAAFRGVSSAATLNLGQPLIQANSTHEHPESVTQFSAKLQTVWSDMHDRCQSDILRI